MKTELTAARLRELLQYDPETGDLIWLKKPTRAAKDGRAGYIDGEGYRRVRIDGRNFYAHRLVWLYVHGEWPKHQIDHKHGARANNRISDMRDVPQGVNVQNIREAYGSKKSCKLLGAFQHRPGKNWQARIRLRGRVISLGYFKTPEEAHAAYVKAKRQLHDGCTI